MGYFNSRLMQKLFLYESNSAIVQSRPTLWDHMVSPSNSPGKNIGVGCHSPLKGRSFTF